MESLRDGFELLSLIRPRRGHTNYSLFIITYSLLLIHCGYYIWK